MDQGQQIRIIVADDHTIFRDSLCKMLALERDFEIVAQAGNGHEVVELCAAQDPDIVLLDLRMPGLDGLEALPPAPLEKVKSQSYCPDGSR